MNLFEVDILEFYIFHKRDLRKTRRWFNVTNEKILDLFSKYESKSLVSKNAFDNYSNLQILDHYKSKNLTIDET